MCTHTLCVYIIYGFLADSCNMCSKLYLFNVKLAGADRTVPTARPVKKKQFSLIHRSNISLADINSICQSF